MIHPLHLTHISILEDLGRGILYPDEEIPQFGSLVPTALVWLASESTSQSLPITSAWVLHSATAINIVEFLAGFFSDFFGASVGVARGASSFYLIRLQSPLDFRDSYSFLQKFDDMPGRLFRPIPE